MRITVFGATGGVGGLVVAQALDAGHKVTAVVRDPARFRLRHPALEVAAVPDLADLDRLRPAVEAADAALSGIGPRSRKDGPVASTATRSIIRALEDTGVRRFVAISAAPVGPVPDGDSFLNRRVAMPLISRLLRPVYDDLGAMEEDLRRSTLEWSVVRPPKFTDKPTTGRYRMSVGTNVPRGYTISRGDVAHAMLAVLADPATVRQPVGIAY
jgi:putative NADH-flavin reductase